MDKINIVSSQAVLEVSLKKAHSKFQVETGNEQNAKQTRTYIFSQTHGTEWTRTVWQTEPEPNCQTGRTEQNPNFMQWVRFTSLHHSNLSFNSTTKTCHSGNTPSTHHPGWEDNRRTGITRTMHYRLTHVWTQRLWREKSTPPMLF